MKKNALLALLSQGKTDQVIAHLKRMAPQQADDLKEEIAQQAARFQSLAREKRLGLLSYEQQSIQEAKINAALIELIRQLPDGPLSSGIRWQKLASWGGLAAALLAALAALAEISGYSLRDIFENKPPVEESAESTPPSSSADTLLLTRPQAAQPQASPATPAKKTSPQPNIKQSTTGDKSPAVVTDEGNVTINYGDWDSAPPKDTTKKQ